MLKLVSTSNSGISQALEWVYTGEIFDAQKAKESGFVRSVHAPEDLMEAAYTLARSIAKKIPSEYHTSKTNDVETALQQKPQGKLTILIRWQYSMLVNWTVRKE